jgi:hypothetical protein
MEPRNLGQCSADGRWGEAQVSGVPPPDIRYLRWIAAKMCVCVCVRGGGPELGVEGERRAESGVATQSPLACFHTYIPCVG